VIIAGAKPLGNCAEMAKKARLAPPAVPPGPVAHRSGKPSSMLDTHVVYCGDNLETLAKLPAGCVDSIYIDPPFNSNRNYEVFWGETKAPLCAPSRTATPARRPTPPCGPAVLSSPACRRRRAAYYYFDGHASHNVKAMLNEILGGNSFVDELTGKRRSAHNDAKRPYILPFVLAVIVVCVLTGCIPGDHARVGGGKRPESLIGPPGSNRPLQLSHSTRRDVIALLGPPQYGTADGRTAVFPYEIRAGKLLVPLPEYNDVYASRYFVVRFGSSGTAESYKVYSQLEDIPEHKRDQLRQLTTWPDEIRFRPGGAGPEPAPPLRSRPGRPTPVCDLDRDAAAGRMQSRATRTACSPTTGQVKQ
jgi:hypothetical protein